MRQCRAAGRRNKLKPLITGLLTYLKKLASLYVNRKKNHTQYEWREISGEILSINIKRTQIVLPILFLFELANLIGLFLSGASIRDNWAIVAGYVLLIAVSIAYSLLLTFRSGEEKKVLEFLHLTCWVYIMIGVLLVTWGFLGYNDSMISATVFVLSVSVIPVMSPNRVAAFLCVFTSFTALLVFFHRDSFVAVRELILLSVIAFLVSAVQYSFTLAIISDYVLLNNKNKKLVEISERDPLTGVLNRRGFTNIMQRRGNPGVKYAVLMIDIDNFKSYNDRFYHDAGDLCLQRVAAALARSVFHDDDLVVRYGGEEFLIYFHNIEKSEVLSAAERIQNEIALMRIDLGNENNYVTVSIGAAFSPEGGRLRINEIIAEADKELYNAKKNGKDCISFGGRISRTNPIPINQTVGDDVMKSIRVQPWNKGRKNLLVVEGRASLFPSESLEPEYTIISVGSIDKAEEILSNRNSFISAAIVAASAIEKDWRDFFARVRSKGYSQNLPVIIADDLSYPGVEKREKEALMHGAWDFVTIPADPSVIKFRLKNAVNRSQLPALNQLKYLAEHDPLTGIFNKNRFFEETREILSIGNSDNYAFIRFDINRLQLINSFFGNEAGDKLLKHIAHTVTDYGKFLYEYSYGRIEADIFAVCIPYESEESVNEFVNYIKEDLKNYPLDFDIIPIFGIYVITNRTMQISVMYDKATLAAKSIKDSYMSVYAYYTEEMGRRITVEQELVNEMNEALESEQFVVCFLPTYRLDTEEPSGAEALVRWIHPEKGLIPPCKFIPVFERNGFIVKLDYYVWETVCRKLSEWLREGYRPLPVSVNVSRVNLYSADLVETLCGLTQKYGIPNSMLNLEITESVYTKNPEIMRDVIKKLRASGFVVMMDDFGNGYSSLNMLKDIEVDALKIDMKFLSDTKNDARSRSIISSVVSMAKRISLETIAEGVEKKDQVEFLASVGCDYAQGFYYSKPMPCDEYEKNITEWCRRQKVSAEYQNHGVI